MLTRTEPCKCDKCGDAADWAGLDMSFSETFLCVFCLKESGETYVCPYCQGNGEQQRWYGMGCSITCSTCEGTGAVVVRDGDFQSTKWQGEAVSSDWSGWHNVEVSTPRFRMVKEVGAEQAEADDGLTECFDCGNPTQRSGLFAEADVYCDECADKHQNEKREQERIRLVDGYPGEWHKDGPGWKMRLKAGPNALYVHVCKCGDSYAYAELQLQGSETKATGASFPCTWIERDNIMEAAAAIRPHAEAMVEVLEGVGDE